MPWEFNVLDFISGFHNEVLNNIMIFISSLNDNGYIWIAIALIFLITKKYRMIGITCALALIIMQITGNFILKGIIDRARPYEVRDVLLLIPEPLGSSFPSGHTFSSFASAIAIFMWNKKIGIAALILAVLIGFSRLYLYVHFPTDVVGAAIFGIIDGIACYYVVKKIILTKQKKIS